MTDEKALGLIESDETHIALLPLRPQESSAWCQSNPIQNRNPALQPEKGQESHMIGGGRKLIQTVD